MHNILMWNVIIQSGGTQVLKSLKLNVGSNNKCTAANFPVKKNRENGMIEK